MRKNNSAFDIFYTNWLLSFSFYQHRQCVSLSVTVDTREVQPHDTGEKEQLGLVNVKVEPGSTSATTTSSTGTRLLHGILSQHPQQHNLGLQNGYGRHLAGHAQMGQPPYTTAAIATTSTPGKVTARPFQKALLRDFVAAVTAQLPARSRNLIEFRMI